MVLAGVGLWLFAALLWGIAPMGGDMNRALFGHHAVRTGSAGRNRGERGPVFVVLSIACVVAGIWCFIGAAVQSLR